MESSDFTKFETVIAKSIGTDSKKNKRYQQSLKLALKQTGLNHLAQEVILQEAAEKTTYKKLQTQNGIYFNQRLAQGKADLGAASAVHFTLHLEDKWSGFAEAIDHVIFDDPIENIDVFWSIESDKLSNSKLLTERNKSNYSDNNQGLIQQSKSRTRSDYFDRYKLVLSGLFVLLIIGIASQFFNTLNKSQPNKQPIKRTFDSLNEAWTYLLAKAGGNTGKGEAINAIVNAEGKISGVDLSCKAIGVWQNGSCANSPILDNIELTEGSFWMLDQNKQTGYYNIDLPYLDDVNLSDTKINNLRAEVFDFSLVNLTNTKAYNWTILNSQRPYGTQDSTVGFECVECNFFNGQLSYDLYKKMSFGTFGNVVVFHTSEDGKLPENPYLSEKVTFTDSPIIFIQAEIDETGPYINDYIPKRGLVIQDTIIWNDYNDFKFCVPLTEIKNIKNDKADMDRINLSDETHKFTRRSNEYGVEPKNVMYSCGYEFQQVEQYLRPRVIDKILNLFPNSFQN